MEPHVVPVTLTVENLPEWLGLSARLSAGDLARAELPETSALAPAAVVLFASIRAARASRGVRTEYTGSDASLVEALEPVVELRTARRLADDLSDALERALPSAAPSVVRAARFVLEELGANICQHSGRPETGFGWLRARPAEESGRFQLAVEKGLSSVGGRSNMGMGLGVLTDLSDRLGADLWIVSGDAMWHRRTSGVGRHRVSVIRTVPHHAGAWICLDAPGFPA